MITKNSNNAGLFKDIEGSKHVESKQMNQNRVALFYFVKEDEVQIYNISDILFKDSNIDCGAFVARMLSVVERYYHKENIVLSIDDMKSVMGEYVADCGFNDKSIKFAKEAIKGYEAAVKDESRIIMLPLETYISALK